MIVTTSFRTRAIKAAIFAAWAVIYASALVQTVPDSPFAFGPRARGNVAILLPQGWSFFTRNAREERILVYESANKEWRLLSVTNAQTGHWLGIKRTSSLISVELTAIIAQVPDTAWREIHGAVEPGTSVGAPATTVMNPGIAHTLCGRFLLRKQPPLPWAWAGSAQIMELPSRIAEVDVKCES